MSEENKNIDPNEEVVDKEAETGVDAPEEGSGTYNFNFEKMYEQDDVDVVKIVKKPKKVSLSTFFISLVACVLAAVMTTWSVCFGLYGTNPISDNSADNFGDVIINPGDLVINGEDNPEFFSELELLTSIFETYSYSGVDNTDMADFMLKAYVAATGDRYAQYFNAEEYEALKSSAMGNSEGIGINVIYTTVSFDGISYKVLKVTNVVRESPAMRAEIKVGDLIFFVGVDTETRESVDYLGYDGALAKLVGAKGTNAEFTVLRQSDDGSYEEIPFVVTRERVVSDSVMYHLCQTDKSVGIVKILGFDYTTPKQFSNAVDELRAMGAEKFVFDVRYNGGGDLASIVAVLSYFLDRGQTIISTVDNQGNASVIKADVVSSFRGEAAGCNVSLSDIGKYKGLRVAVLCNSSTASAAELFTATFRDYKIGKVIGETTFGKGSMQSILSLEYFGMEGALKLTTNMYFPPCGESYEGEGITPDVIVELDDALRNKNIYEYTDAEDNQLQAAIQTLK